MTSKYTWFDVYLIFDALHGNDNNFVGSWSLTNLSWQGSAAASSSTIALISASTAWNSRAFSRPRSRATRDFAVDGANVSYACRYRSDSLLGAASLLQVGRGGDAGGGGGRRRGGGGIREVVPAGMFLRATPGQIDVK